MRLPGLLALLLLLAAARPAEAACVTDGVVLFPRPGAVIPTNAQLVLEGRGTAADTVHQLVGKQLHLVDDVGQQVVLDVRKGWRSDMRRAAVRLIPRQKLKPDSRYRLAAPGLRSLDEVGDGPPWWRTGDGPDTRRPKWAKKPGPAGGRYFTDDGRLHRELRFNLALDDSSPGYVVVTLRRARGKAPPQTYFAPVLSSQVVLGHDGCSGSFTFDDGRAYFARFQAFDAAGQPAPVVAPLEIHAPKPERE